MVTNVFWCAASGRAHGGGCGGGVAPMAVHAFLKRPVVPPGAEFECKFARCLASKKTPRWAIADRIRDVVFEKGIC